MPKHQIASDGSVREEDLWCVTSAAVSISLLSTRYIGDGDRRSTAARQLWMLPRTELNRATRWGLLRETIVGSVVVIVRQILTDETSQVLRIEQEVIQD